MSVPLTSAGTLLLTGAAAVVSLGSWLRLRAKAIGWDPVATRRLQNTVERTQRQALAMSRVSQLEALIEGDVDGGIREIAELASRALGCERVNVWLFNDDETELHCIESFEASGGRHSSGAVLREPDFAPEFEVLRDSRYVDADDPLTDPRTAGYVEPYLKPLGITSMLDAVIRVSGRHLGLICFEHVGQPHHWEPDEIAFGCQLADKIGLALITRRRLDSERELRASQAALELANTILRTQMETSLDGILVVDANRRLLSFNQRFAEMWSVPASALESDESAAIVALARDQVLDPDTFVARISEVYDNPEFTGRDTIEMRDGRLLDRHTSALRGPDGQYLGRVWFFRDITDRARAEALLQHSARHDSLTGLVNRVVFQEAIEQAIARMRRGSQRFAVLCLDLDHFKDINDTRGHQAGDELLEQVALRLRGACRATDTVARFGGDEFAVLVSDVGAADDAATVAETLIAAVARVFQLSSGDVHIGSSIGIALPRSVDIDAETLLSQADVALYRAKADGGTYHFFTDVMEAEVRSRVTLASELRTAIASGQLTLHYQPQINVTTGRITGVEALVRWRHPARGLIEPAVFIPIAERTGQIAALGTWVLRESCRQARVWREAGYGLERIAVNLSAVQFKDPRQLERDVLGIVAESGLPPSAVELELTETALVAASQQDEILGRLRAAGLRLAIDDFGTGYSSLDYLRRFRVDRIKIARNFVAQVAPANGDAAIVRATIRLASELGIAVLAEGVESIEQLQLLQAWGCQDVQGFYFCAALAPADIEPLLRAGIIPDLQPSRLRDEVSAMPPAMAAGVLPAGEPHSWCAYGAQ